MPENTKETQQLRAWRGEFGDAYTERNAYDWRAKVPAFRQMLEGRLPKRILEVGCNRGNNLLTMHCLFPDAEIVGIEPNGRALEAARAASVKVAVLAGHAFDLPFKDGYFDLVFTSGVLIHVALAELPTALREIHRVSARCILAIEYFAEEETVIPYRGSDSLLWKRNFLKHYQREFPELTAIRSGYWGVEDGFDRTNWWLLEKPRT